MSVGIVPPIESSPTPMAEWYVLSSVIERGGMGDWLGRRGGAEWIKALSWKWSCSGDKEDLPDVSPGGAEGTDKEECVIDVVVVGAGLEGERWSRDL